MKYWLSHRMTTSTFLATILGLTACGMDDSNIGSTASNEIPISTATDDQVHPQITTDGAGGAIIVWEDTRIGSSGSDIYAQRIDSAGVVQWITNGVAISTAAGNQERPELIADGAGGAIIVWQGSVNGDRNIYAQRINSIGALQWAADGVAISAATGDQTAPRLITDGAGGAIIVWDDWRNGHGDIYAQHVNSSGVAQWAADGMAISTATSNQYIPQLTEDGAGGVIIVWQDTRNNIFEIYAQRVNNAGVAQWAVDGVAISTSVANSPYDPHLISDGAGGAIIAWEDSRNGGPDIYAQRVNSTGVAQWAVDGVAVSTAAVYQQSPRLIADGAGGAIIAWEDRRNFNSDIYAQRVNSAGAVQWAADDVAICTADSMFQKIPYLTTDGAGGAIIAWEDSRNNFFTVYTQRVNSAGVVQWVANGVHVTTEPSGQSSPRLIANGAGGAIIAWEDSRNFVSDIYAQIISANGNQ